MDPHCAYLAKVSQLYAGACPGLSRAAVRDFRLRQTAVLQTRRQSRKPSRARNKPIEEFLSRYCRHCCASLSDSATSTQKGKVLCTLCGASNKADPSFLQRTSSGGGPFPPPQRASPAGAPASSVAASSSGCLVNDSARRRAGGPNVVVGKGTGRSEKNHAETNGNVGQPFLSQWAQSKPPGGQAGGQLSGLRSLLAGRGGLSAPPVAPPPGGGGGGGGGTSASSKKRQRQATMEQKAKAQKKGDFDF